MRLWHKDLISVLPRQQLLGQWRELCAIMANIEKNGTPNHVLVNKIMDYPLKHLLEYALEVQDEMKLRGYKCDFDRFADRYRASTLSQKGSNLIIWHRDLYEGWHDGRYLTQCYCNLQEKYDCGGISEEEWEKIEYRYAELTGDLEAKQ